MIADYITYFIFMISVLKAIAIVIQYVERIKRLFLKLEEYLDKNDRQ